MGSPADYDSVAGAYDRRYERNDYAGVERAVLAFAAGLPATAGVLEVGCGTGHWLAALAGGAALVAGVDPSRGMLERARRAAPDALLVRARAEALPWRSASVDRVVCVNAFHHFADKAAFVAEARRVLRPGGGLLIVGLDPHTGRDQWWVYDYFPRALELDRGRYPPAPAIRALLARVGFVRCHTAEAQHMPASVSAAAAAERGLLDRSATSQLMVLGDDEYDAGLRRIRAAGEAAASRGEALQLTADLRVYATQGWVPGGPSA